MGKLFWKCFLATWVTLILTGFVTLWGVTLYRQAENTDRFFHRGPRTRFELDGAEAVLRNAGATALAAFLNETSCPMTVVGPDGRDIRHGSLDPGQEAVLDSLRGAPLPDGIRRVTVPTGTYTLFIPDNVEPFPPGDGLIPHPPGPPAPWEPLLYGFLASITLSALLAWYLARPIKRLRSAFAAMAAGRLDTRVGNLMRRGDEIAELGREFDDMAAKLQNLLLAQRRLLHDVSHELRSPLGRLQVAMGILRHNPASVEAALDRMEREVQRLDELIGEILTLARLNSGAENNVMELVDVGELVESIVHDAQFEAGDKGCEVRLQELVQVHVQGNPRLLSRAVENVIRNGLKYSPPASILDVTVGFSEGDAVIEIGDQGPGIPADELESVFEPFHRGRGNGNPDGFGLGLAIARGAVELHGGSIAARNQPAGGLTVKIRLPIHESSPQA